MEKLRRRAFQYLLDSHCLLASPGSVCSSGTVEEEKGGKEQTERKVSIMLDHFCFSTESLSQIMDRE